MKMSLIHSLFIYLLTDTKKIDVAQISSTKFVHKRDYKYLKIRLLIFCSFESPVACSCCLLLTTVVGSVEHAVAFPVEAAKSKRPFLQAPHDECQNLSE